MLSSFGGLLLSVIRFVLFLGDVSVNSSASVSKSSRHRP